MRIGFILPATFALDGPGNGVRAQAVAQAEALRRRGHEVIGLEPWNLTDPRSLDVVQFFTGGFPTYTIEHSADRGVRNLVWAPMIDTNEPNWRYRIATALGGVVPKMYTIPGVFLRQALGSKLVICRSRHERDRVVQGLGIDPAAVGVEIVLNGVTPPVDPDPSLARSQLDLPDQFILHVSAFTQGRKNVARLIDAAGPLNLPLVIAGTAPPGAALEDLRTRAERYGNVRFLGFLSREVLTSLYAACRVFCLPSIHEGTGLVALEAAACGAAVVITSHGGPPDYFGDLAHYCDPLNTQSIRSAIEAAWNQTDRQSLRHHVTTHLTWDQSAAALVRAYERYCTA